MYSTSVVELIFFSFDVFAYNGVLWNSFKSEKTIILHENCHDLFTRVTMLKQEYRNCDKDMELRLTIYFTSIYSYMNTRT